MSLVSQYFARKHAFNYRAKKEHTFTFNGDVDRSLNLRRRTINALIQILCANGMEFPDQQTRRPFWTFDSRS